MTAGGDPAFRNHQIACLRPGEFDVGAGGVEVGVIGNHVPRSAEHGEQNPFRGPTLVGGQDVAKAEDVVHRRLEAVPGAASGIRLVPPHDGGPLLRAHGCGAAVGQQVDEYVLGRKQEDIKPGSAQLAIALVGRRHPNRLDGLNLERLYDGPHWLNSINSPCHCSVGHSSVVLRRP